MYESPVLEVAAVQRGDLLFMQSPGNVQRLVNSAGDQYRHTAIVTKIQEHTWVLEAGRAGFRARPLSTVTAAYHRIDVLRLLDCPNRCGARIERAALDLMSEPTKYPDRLELAIAGLLSMARAYLPDPDSRLRGELHRRVETRLGAKDEARKATLCASLVVRAMRHTCPLHRPLIDLRLAKNHRAAKADALADFYALPDDIWRSLDHASRFQLRTDEQPQPSSAVMSASREAPTPCVRVARC